MSAEIHFNLDALAAKTAQEIVRGVKKGGDQQVRTLRILINKAIGVLQEQGVYALLLFLFSRSGDEEEVAPVIRTALYRAIRSLPGFESKSHIQALGEDKDQPERVLEAYVKDVVGDLDALLLVRDLYEQILIYTRYGAKAAGG